MHELVIIETGHIDARFIHEEIQLNMRVIEFLNYQILPLGEYADLLLLLLLLLLFPNGRCFVYH